MTTIHQRLAEALGPRSARITSIRQARAGLREEADALNRVLAKHPHLNPLHARLDMIDALRSQLDTLEGTKGRTRA